MTIFKASAIRALSMTACGIAALCLSQVAVAQQSSTDEFTAFRETLNKREMPAADVPVVIPIRPPQPKNTGTTPQTPEELQAMLDQESLYQRQKLMEQKIWDIRTGLDDKAAADEKTDSADITADSHIDSVTVYNSGARITRVVEVEIPAGKHNIVIKGLPLAADADSFRAEGTAAGQVTLGAITTRTDVSADFVSPQEREAYQKLMPLLDQRHMLNEEAGALDAQYSFLQTLATQALTQADKNIVAQDIKADQWGTAAKSLHDALLAVSRDKEALRIKQRDLDSLLGQAANVFLQRKPSRTSTSALVPLEAEKATRLKLRLSYQVSNATWQPVYDARLVTKDAGAFELTQFGSVRQQTGEDWKDVTLTLSTSQPARSANLPELQSSWVNIMPLSTAGSGNSTVPGSAPVPAGNPLQEWRAKAEARRLTLDEQAPPPEDGASVPVTIAGAVIDNGGYVSEYKIPGPATVASDGTTTKLMIGTFPLDSRLQVHIRPQISTNAYLATHAVLKGDSPLLSGVASLFRDGAYVGKLTLPLLRPGAATDIYFGIDDRVAVTHKTVKDERGQTGLIDKDNSLDRSFVTQVENLHKDPVDIVFAETVPASRDEKLKLDILGAETTEGYKADNDNVKGLLKWSFNIKPQEKKDMKLGWHLSWPKDFSLSGL